MNTKQYQYVVAVSETRSFVKAARQLNVAPSYLSKQIQLIENELGRSLFDRSHVPLSLSPEGEIFAAGAWEILNAERRMALEMRDIENVPGGTLRIALSAYRSAYMLPKILPIFYRKCKGVRVELTEVPVEQVNNLVVSGKVDIGIAPDSYHTPDITRIAGPEEEILLAVPVSHPINARIQAQPNELPAISLTALGDTPFSLLENGTSLYAMAMNLFGLTGYTPRTTIEARSLESVYSLVIADLCAALIPSTMMPGTNKPGLPHFYRIEDVSLKRSLCFLYRKNSYLSKAARALIEIVNDNY